MFQQEIWSFFLMVMIDIPRNHMIWSLQQSLCNEKKDYNDDVDPVATTVSDEAMVVASDTSGSKGSTTTEVRIVVVSKRQMWNQRRRWRGK